jgi:ribose transport system substrate-binding protein
MRATDGRRRARRWIGLGLVLGLAGCAPAASPSLSPGAAATPAPSGDVRAEAAAAIAKQGAQLSQWAGPAESSTRAAKGIEIDYIAADGTNGGATAVFTGLQQASAAMGWTAVLRDGVGSPGGRSDAMLAAMAAGPAAIIAGGFDPEEQRDLIAQAESKGIVVLGWHAGAVAGPSAGSLLFTNISTRPSDVAILAADYVINESGGKAGVAIFTDTQYGIAIDKANLMKAQIERCSGCEVLAYLDVAIADAGTQMPPAVRSLRAQFGKRLTYLLGINGNYFGGSRSALQLDGVGPGDPPHAVAAGDGDAAEFDRIRTGQYQVASVAEPLYLQGWQLVDEINRALAGAGPSSYVPEPGLVKFDTVPKTGDVWDPDAAYRATYKRLWQVGQ